MAKWVQSWCKGEDLVEFTPSLGCHNWLLSRWILRAPCHWRSQQSKGEQCPGRWRIILKEGRWFHTSVSAEFLFESLLFKVLSDCHASDTLVWTFFLSPWSSASDGNGDWFGQMPPDKAPVSNGPINKVFPVFVFINSLCWKTQSLWKGSSIEQRGYLWS